jgi:hypothetical protein
MAHLHLPAQHTERDLALAGTLAELLDSEDLYVAYSVDTGPAAPAIPAAIRESTAPAQPRRRRRRRTSLVVALLDGLVARRQRAA